VSAFSLQKPCATCEGTGSVEEQRELYLEELSGTQMDFLYKAEIERMKAENGADEETERELQKAKRKIPNTGQSSPMPGSPPVGGNTRKF